MVTSTLTEGVREELSQTKRIQIVSKDNTGKVIKEFSKNVYNQLYNKSLETILNDLLEKSGGSLTDAHQDLKDQINNLETEKVEQLRKLERAVSRHSRTFIDQSNILSDTLKSQERLTVEISALQKQLKTLDWECIISSDIYLALLCRRRAKIESIKEALEIHAQSIISQKEVKLRADALMASLICYDGEIINELLIEHHAGSAAQCDSTNGLRHKLGSIPYTPICITRLIDTFSKSNGFDTQCQAIRRDFTALISGDATQWENIAVTLNFISYFETIPIKLRANAFRTKKNVNGSLYLYVLAQWTVEINHLLNSWIINTKGKHDPRDRIAVALEILTFWLHRIEAVLSTDQCMNYETGRELNKTRKGLWDVIDKRLAQGIDSILTMTGSWMKKSFNNEDLLELMYLLMKFIREGSRFIGRDLNDLSEVSNHEVCLIRIMSEDSPNMVKLIDRISWDQFSDFFSLSINHICNELVKEEWTRETIPHDFCLFHGPKKLVAQVDPRYCGGNHDGYSIHESNPFTNYNTSQDKRRWPLNLIRCQRKKWDANSLDREMSILEHRLSMMNMNEDGLETQRRKEFQKPVVTKIMVIIAHEVEKYIEMIQMNPSMTLEVLQAVILLVEFMSYFMVNTLAQKSWISRLTLAVPPIESLTGRCLTTTLASLHDQIRFSELATVLQEFQRIQRLKIGDSLNARAKLLKGILQDREAFASNIKLGSLKHRYGASERLIAATSLQHFVKSLDDTLFSDWDLSYLGPRETKLIKSEWEKCQKLTYDVKDLLLRDAARTELAKKGEQVLDGFKNIDWESDSVTVEGLLLILDKGLKPEGLSRKNSQMFHGNLRCLEESNVIEALMESERFFDDIFIAFQCLGGGSIPLKVQHKFWVVIREEFYKMWLYFMARIAKKCYDSSKNCESLSSKSGDVSLIFQRLLLCCQYVTKIILQKHQNIIDQLINNGVNIPGSDTSSRLSLEACIAYAESYALNINELIPIGKYWMSKGAFDFQMVCDIASRIDSNNKDNTKKSEVLKELEDWSIDWIKGISGK